jgi:hypothetical protein
VLSEWGRRSLPLQLLRADRGAQLSASPTDTRCSKAPNLTEPLVSADVATIANQINRLFSTALPQPSVAFDLFKDEWVSDVPGFGMGPIPLFDDGRIK